MGIRIGRDVIESSLPHISEVKCLAVHIWETGAYVCVVYQVSCNWDIANQNTIRAFMLPHWSQPLFQSPFLRVELRALFVNHLVVDKA